MIDIDGSMGEGGGQIIRSAVALSALTGRDCRICEIRAGRKRPGLAAQHIAGIRGVAMLCGAELEGDALGSSEIVFRPRALRRSDIRVDVGTAGSVTLVLQACLLPVIGSGESGRVAITGGTNVRWSPPLDYLNHVVMPLLGRMGVRAKMNVSRRGFHPEGGGEVELDVSPPASLRPLWLEERGGMLSLSGVCFSQNLPDHVCERMSRSARKVLSSIGDADIRHEGGKGGSTGAGICLFARYKNTVLGSDALGERGVPSESVGREAAGDLLVEIEGGGTLDVHAADQLLPYMAMANGPSHFSVGEVSDHLRTQARLLPMFLDVDVRFEEGDLRFEVWVEPSHT